MSFTVTNQGDQTILSAMLANNPKLHLYNNSYAPVKGTTGSNFTETTVSGYTAVALTGSSWTIATDGSNNTTATHGSVTFTICGAEVIQGYYVTTNDGTKVLFAEQYATPKAYDTNGGSLTVSSLVWQAN